MALAWDSVYPKESVEQIVKTLKAASENLILMISTFKNSAIGK